MSSASGQCPGHKGWHPATMAECIADLMASNGRNACPVCGLWRTPPEPAPAYSPWVDEFGRVIFKGRRHTATGSITRNGAFD